MKRRVFHPVIGWRTPQLQMQITPLQWGIGGAIGEHKLAFCIGPIAFAFYWGKAPLEKYLK